MKKTIWGAQIYTFLRECEKTVLEKDVLDCGAGGDPPPLVLFHEFGYKTLGIDISEKQIAKASEYSKKHNLELNIKKGDMRQLPFKDESKSFVYSINSIIFMTKKDILHTMKEIERVLKPNGLCFVNFLSVDDEEYEQGKKIAEGEFLQGGFDWIDEEVFQSFFTDCEPDKFFQNFDIIRKEKRVVERKCEHCNNIHKQAFIDYLAKKN